MPKPIRITRSGVILSPTTTTPTPLTKPPTIITQARPKLTESQILKVKSQHNAKQAELHTSIPVPEKRWERMKTGFLKELLVAKKIKPEELPHISLTEALRRSGIKKNPITDAWLVDYLKEKAVFDKKLGTFDKISNTIALSQDGIDFVNLKFTEISRAVWGKEKN